MHRWYIYYTAGNNKNLDGQRPHVLKGKRNPDTPLLSFRFESGLTSVQVAPPLGTAFPMLDSSRRTGALTALSSASLIRCILSGPASHEACNPCALQP